MLLFFLGRHWVIILLILQCILEQNPEVCFYLSTVYLTTFQLCSSNYCPCSVLVWGMWNMCYCFNDLLGSAITCYICLFFSVNIFFVHVWNRLIIVHATISTSAFVDGTILHANRATHGHRKIEAQRRINEKWIGQFLKFK